MFEWMPSRKAALQDWYDSLPEDQKASVDQFRIKAKAESEARRLARLARQAAREARDAQVIGLVLRGQTTDEIAEALNMKPRNVRVVLMRLGIERTTPGYRRIPSGWISVATREQIHKVAAERGMQPTEVIERLLSYAFEENAHHARRLLGKGGVNV